MMPVDWEKLLGDPLFQLNLSLWMTQPCPIVNLAPRPLLREVGYEVYQIEPRLTLPLATQAALRAAKLAFSQVSEPDIVFRGAQGKILLWECKKSLFGYDPSKDDREYRQARTFLLATKAFAEDALGLPKGSVPDTHLNYCTVHKDKIPQFEGIQSIAQELQTAKFATTATTAFLRRVKDNQLGFSVKSSSAALPPALQAVMKGDSCDILNLGDSGADPRPLYYYPWMPDSEAEPDNYSMEQFGNRVLAAAAQHLGPLKPPYTAEIIFEEILRLVYNPFFQNWRNMNQRRHVKSKAFELVSKQILSVNTKKNEHQVHVKQEPLAGSLGKLVVIVPDDNKLHQRIIEALHNWRPENVHWFAPKQEEFPLQEITQGSNQ
jgi:hypothetical protein